MADLDGTYVRVCPDCDAEFVSTVELCHDCGIPLETRLANGSADPAAAALGAAAPTANDQPPDGWVSIQTADLDWALELRDRLRETGVAARLIQDCESCRPTLGVFVAPEDLAAAHEVARRVYVERVPDAARGGNVELATDRCPSCGERVAETAESCPECGLAFAPLPEPAEQ